MSFLTEVSSVKPIEALLRRLEQVAPARRKVVEGSRGPGIPTNGMVPVGTSPVASAERG
jgi:hypothetical protein